MAKLLGKTGFHAKYHLAACHGGAGKSCCTFPRLLLHRKKKIKSSLYSRLYAETCNEWWSPSPWLSTWTTQLRRNIAAVVSCWRHCIRFDRPGNRTQTSCIDSDIFNNHANGSIFRGRSPCINTG